MAETWYFTNASGAACGPGTRQALSQTAGSSAQTQDVTSEQTWNRTESARSIAAGTWTLTLDVTTGSGGGAPNRITAVIERRNSSCTVQETIGSQTSSNLSAGSSETVTLTYSGVSQIDFSSGDILTVRIVRSNGNRSQVIDYNGSSGGASDSRLDHPDPPAGSPTFDHTNFQFYADDGSESAATALAAVNTDITLASDGECRYRGEIDNDSANNAAAENFRLEYSHNSGSYSNVFATSSVIINKASAFVSDNTVTTNRISGVGSTFTAGLFESSSGVPASIAVDSDEHTEIEFMLGIVTADVSDGDTIDLRYYSTDGSTFTYTNIGRITIGSGTETPQSVAGTLSFTSGTIAKLVGKAVAGTLSTAGTITKLISKILSGTLTTAGDVSKEVQKPLSGTLTTAGDLTASKVANQATDGTLTTAGAITKLVGKVVSGTLTSVGALARSVGKSVTGTLTSSGDISKEVQKPVAGTLTTAGSLSAIKTAFRTATGTLSTAGSLTKQVIKSFTGTLTSAGTIVKQVQKPLAGTLTTAGSLDAIKTAIQAITGTLTTAGSLAKSIGKVIAGTLTSSGDITKQINKSTDGTLSSSGDTSKQTNKPLSGTLTSAGSLTPTYIPASGTEYPQSVAGTLTTAGAIAKSVLKAITGTLTTAGSIVKQVGKSTAGTLTTSGDISKQINKSPSGTLTFSGSLDAVKTVVQSVAGTLTSTGALARLVGKAVNGTLTSAGTISRIVSKGTVGTLTPSGDVNKDTSKSFAGTVTMSGALSTLFISGAAAIPSDITLSETCTYDVTIDEDATYSLSLTIQPNYMIDLNETEAQIYAVSQLDDLGYEVAIAITAGEDLST